MSASELVYIFKDTMGLNGANLAGAITGGIIGGLLLLILLLFIFRVWMQGGQCRSLALLHGKTAVITGANTGIGKETAKDLSRRGAKVVMLCRNMDKAEDVAKQIRNSSNGEVVVINMDLSSLESVREAAEKVVNTVDKVDILINNAGVMACPLRRTKEGFELQFGTNHLGHFLLTKLLMPSVKKAAPGARVVNVSSLVHSKGVMQWDDLNFERSPYDPMKAYYQSKLANVLFTKELARRLEGTGVTTYALHPGVINTEIGRNFGDSYGAVARVAYRVAGPFMKTAVSGAQTSIYCAVEEGLEGSSGKYFSDCREVEVARQADSEEDAKRLWDKSEEFVKKT